MEHNIYKNLRASWLIQYRKRNGTYIPYDIGTGEWLNPEAYKAFWLLDFRLFYQQKNFKVFAEGSDLLDIKYQDIENVGLPGRWLRAGLSINIRFKE